MGKRLKRNCEKSVGPMGDYVKKLELRKKQNNQSKKAIRRENDYLFRDFMMSLVLCHNVTPSFTDEGKVYQASSPDEIAMVKFSELLNLKLVSRDLNSMEVELPTGKREKYKILAIFPFSSETKSMGIVVRHEET